jgi:hypothetical protein
MPLTLTNPALTQAIKRPTTPNTSAPRTTL